VLHYQPHIDLRTGRCVGAEALARWQHPSLGLIPPGTFIPLAERTGHIIALGNHVLVAACRQMAAWIRRSGVSDLRIAVNVAPRQLDVPGFADTVLATLADSGLPPAQLILEITESELIDERNARDQLRRVAEAVETERQAAVVRRAGVPLAQGFLFARPMPAEAFPAWLAAHSATESVAAD
jgi:diguanylate cyclase